MLSLIIGQVLLVGGIAASGGSSKIFIGAIIVGVIQIIRGLISFAD
jgi:hypothetical protein